MSHSLLNDLLHKTLKDLHTLHTFQPQSTELEYATLLRTAVRGILQLLNYNDKIYSELDVSVSSASGIDPSNWIYYLNRPTGGSAPTSAGKVNIVDFIQGLVESTSYVGATGTSSSNVLSQLVSLLSNMSDDKKPARLKDSYSVILVKLSELIQFFIKLHRDSELKLINFLAKCITYELNFYSSLQEKLNSSINQEDTEKLVNFLEGYFKTKTEQLDSNSLVKEEDSLMDYESIAPTFNPSLNLHSNNEAFSKIYYVFLNILSFKKFAIKDFRSYIKLMVDLFKNQNDVQFFEINTFDYKEKKFDYFYNFFMGDTANSGVVILPSRFKITNERIISEVNIFPEMDIENSFSNLHNQTTEIDLNEHMAREYQPADLKNVLSAEYDNVDDLPSFQIRHPFSAQDQANLTNALTHVIPLLNEFFYLNESFPKSFKYYMKLLYDTLPTFSVQADISFVCEVEYLVRKITGFAFEDEAEDKDLDPSGSIIQKYVHRFQELHNFLNRDPMSSSTLLMRIASVEYEIIETHTRYTFLMWHSKTAQVMQIESALKTQWTQTHPNLLKKRYLQQWFSKKYKFSSLTSEAAIFSTKNILERFFHDKWNSKQLMNESMIQKADIQFVRSLFNTWRNKLAYIQEQQLEMSKEYDTRLVKKSLHAIVRYYIFNKELALDADRKLAEFTLSRNSVFLQEVWNGWYNKMNTSIITPATSSFAKKDSRTQDILLIEPTNMSEKLNKLRALEIHWLHTRYFQKITKAYALSKLLAVIRSKNEDSLVKNVFRVFWLTKFELRQREIEFNERRNNSLKLASLDNWKKLKDMASNAAHFHRTQTLKKSMHRWKIKHRLAKAEFKESSINKITLANSFRQWVIKYQARPFQVRVRSSLTKRYFEEWHAKTRRFDEIQPSETKVCKDLQRKFLFNWIQEVNNLYSKQDKADIQFASKFFEKMRSKYLEVRNLEQHAQIFRNIGTKYTLKLAFGQWKSTRERKFRRDCSYKVWEFEERITNPNLLRSALDTWINAYNSVQETRMEMNQRCNEFLNRSGLKKQLFLSWSNKSRHHSHLVEQANEFRYRSLHKRFLLNWYNRFYHYRYLIVDSAEDHQYRREVKKVRDILNLWSMKLTKTVKRNEQNYEIFTSKWNNMRLKSILDLWLYKQIERDNLKQDTEFGSNNSSFSSSSPLANKFSRIHMDSSRRDSIEPENYLVTPVKDKFSNRAPILTPGVTRISPIKLQETTQRLRTERIDELRRHFGKAKETSTPSRAAQAGRASSRRIRRQRLADSDSSRFIELAPPNGNGFASIRPPSPPNFDIEDRRNSSADISSANENQGPPSSAALEAEQVVIENAKRLRRITPIRFPTEDDLNQPTFSPVDKLKERSRNNFVRLSPSRDIGRGIQ